MTQEEKQRMMVEAKHFYLAAPVVLPLIQNMKHIAFMRLMAKHRDGDTNYQTLVSELAVLDQLEREINQKEVMYRTMEESSANPRRN